MAIAERHPGRAPFVGVEPLDHRERFARIVRADTEHRISAAIGARLRFRLELLPCAGLPALVAHGTVSTIEPVVRRDSRSACARDASANGKVVPMSIRTLPLITM